MICPHSDAIRSGGFSSFDSFEWLFNACSFTRVQSVMVELRRDLYMGEATGEKLAGPFQRLQAVLTELRGKLEEFAARGDSTQHCAFLKK